MIETLNNILLKSSSSSSSPFNEDLKQFLQILLCFQLVSIVYVNLSQSDVLQPRVLPTSGTTLSFRKSYLICPTRWPRYVVFFFFVMSRSSRSLFSGFKSSKFKTSSVHGVLNILRYTHSLTYSLCLLFMSIS